MESGPGSGPRYLKPTPALLTNDLPPGAPGHSDPRPQHPPPRNLLACLSPGPAHRQQKGKGGRRRRLLPGTIPRLHPRALQGCSERPTRPATPEGKAGLRGAAVPRGAAAQGEREEGGEKGRRAPARRVPPGPAAYPAPRPVRPRPRKRRAAPAPSGATVTPQRPPRCARSPERPCPALPGHAARPRSRPRRPPVGSGRLPGKARAGRGGAGENARRLAASQ